MKIFQRIILALSKIVFPAKVYGKGNIPSGKCVIVFNHLSCVDPLYILRTYKKFDVRILAKKEIFDHKILGMFVKSFGGVPIDRDNPGLKVVSDSIKTLKNGNKLMLAPEGTRNKTGSLTFLPFKPGTCLFSAKSKSAICPIIIGKKASILKRNYIIIGKPIEFSEYYDKKLEDTDYVEMREKLRTYMEQLQSELFQKMGKK